MLINAALALCLFLVNLYVTWPLFFTYYVKHMFSIEAAYIALTRYAAENWHDLTWFPLWNAGEPYQNSYQPGLPLASAMLTHVFHLNPALGYHIAIALFYCIAPVGFFYLVLRMSGRRDVAFCSALFLSLLSPSGFLVSTIRHDMGSVWYARRFQTLIFFGEGPNVSGLSLMPFGLWGVYEVCQSMTPLRFCLAAVALACTVVVSWPAGVVMVAGIVAFLLSRRIDQLRTDWWRVALLAGSAYALIAPWMPPSTVRDNQRNSQMIGGPYHYTTKHIVYFGLLLFCTAVLRWLLRNAAPALQFAGYWTVFLGAIALGAYWGGIALFPQPERFHLGLEFALVPLMAYAVVFALRVRRQVWIAGLALLLIGSFFQAKRYRRYADRLSAPIKIESTLEYQVSRWFADHLPNQRVMSAGSVGFWMNAWSDTPQVTGCCLPGMPNPISWIVGYAVPSGDGAGSHDAEYSLLWMRAFGAHAVMLGGAQTRDSYHDWRQPMKFEGVLPKLWQSGDDRIYSIPSRTLSLAHVVPRSALVSKPPQNGLDVAALQTFVGALEDPTLPTTTWQWENRHAAVIRAVLAPGQVIHAQVTYTPGWHAKVDNRAVPLASDGLGLITIDPNCQGNCQVKLDYDGGIEMQSFRLLSWIVKIALLVWICWAALSRKHTTRYNAIPIPEHA